MDRQMMKTWHNNEQGRGKENESSIIRTFLLNLFTKQPPPPLSTVYVSRLTVRRRDGLTVFGVKIKQGLHVTFI